MTDIIALIANADAPPSAYAFLHDSRFRERPDVKAKHFVGEIVWCSGDKQRRGLEESVPGGTIPQVRYIPQNYFETLCNETRDAGQLQQELRKVIFSNLTDIQRGRFSTLDELINDRTSEGAHRVDELRAEVRSVNREIVDLERELSRSRQSELADELTQREAALAAHDRSVPPEVTKPVEAQDTGAIDTGRVQLATIEQLTTEEQRRLQELHEAKAATDRVTTRLQTLADAIGRARDATLPDLQRLRLTFEDIFSGGPQFKAVEDTRRQADALIVTAETRLNGVGGLVEQAATVRQGIAALQETLNAPTLAYQQYLDRKRQWDERRAAIVGTSEIPGTIEHLRWKLEKGRADQSGTLADLIARRQGLAQAIHFQQLEIAGYLKTLYSAVETRLGKYPGLLEQLRVNFDATLADNGLSPKFMAMINRNRVGIFSEETSMRDRLTEYDFNCSEDLEKFLEVVVDALHRDAKGNLGDVDALQRQLRGQSTPEDIYNLLFGLEYLVPKYALRVRDRELHQLTPGERGSLLLVFYLIIDLDDRPLIIDQPEENLDNQSVYELLVPCIKDSKRRRQIIMVTHNPNLAVVCNAEQVVWCKIDKDGDHAVSYETGGLENPITKKHVVDVLEGTWPAFVDRGAKYRSRALPE